MRKYIFLFLNLLLISIFIYFVIYETDVVIGVLNRLKEEPVDSMSYQTFKGSLPIYIRYLVLYIVAFLSSVLTFAYIATDGFGKFKSKSLKELKADFAALRLKAKKRKLEKLQKELNQNSTD